MPGGLLSAESAPRVELLPGASSVAPGSEIAVTVLVSSEAPVNAFRIALEYPPNNLEFLRASTARSFASVWEPGSPRILEEEGVVLLSGGATRSFWGKSGELITLVFRARREGRGIFSVRSAEFYLADGKGTKQEAMGSSREVAVRASAPETRVPTESAEPRFSNVSITWNPLACPDSKRC